MMVSSDNTAPATPSLKTRMHARFGEWRARGGWRFGLKAALALGLLVGGMEYTKTRFMLGYDQNIHQCIADYSVFGVDRHNHVLARDNLYAFSWEGNEAFFDPGETLVKFLVGLPGDTIEVTADERVLINGVEYGDTLQAASVFGMAPDRFVGKTTLADNEYWFMGDTPESFDSRYWGSVSKEQIIGRAYGFY